MAKSMAYRIIQRVIDVLVFTYNQCDFRTADVQFLSKRAAAYLHTCAWQIHSQTGMARDDIYY